MVKLPMDLVAAALANPTSLQRELCRHHYLSFIEQFSVEDPPARHHKVIIDKLQQVADGQIKRLMVFAPPGSGKSVYSNALFASWFIARYPNKRVISASHKHEMAEAFARRSRNLVASKEFEAVFGQVLSDDTRSAAKWDTLQGGGLVATGAGAGIAGQRADLVIIDDPFGSRQDALDDRHRDRIWHWWVQDIRTRGKKDWACVLINCLTGDTPITMGDGSWKPLRDVRPGDEVLAWKDRTLVRRKVLNWAPQGEDDILEIRTGSSRVRANARHPFLVQRPHGVEWVRAGELRKGDDLITSGRIEDCHEARLTQQEAWVLGYMFGDGWVTIRKPTFNYDRLRDKYYPRRGVLACCALTRDEEWNRIVLTNLAQIFGVAWKVTKHGYARTDVQRVSNWLLEHGLIGKAKTKRLPKWIFSQPIEIREAFLQGYCDADGHVLSTGLQKGRWSISSSNRDLLQDVRQLGRSCGHRTSNVSSSTNWIKAPNSPEPIESTIHNCQWSPWLRSDDSFRTSRIRSIVPCGREEVFDIQVEDAETFIADGLVTHNTRWHEDDLSGRLERQMKEGGEQWEILRLPAIATEEDQPDPLGRKPGEPLWPEWQTKEILEAERKIQGPTFWSALYQQRPVADEGAVFRKEWFRYYSKLPPNMTFYGASDYAVVRTGDYTVHIIVGVDEDQRIYVVDIWRGRETPDVWVDEMINLVERWKPVEWAEESGHILRSIGPFIDRTMEEKKIYCVRTQFPTSGGHSHQHNANKLTRVQAIRGFIAQRGLYIPYDSEWSSDFVREMIEFPAGRNDDQVDALGLFGRLLYRLRDRPGLREATDPPQKKPNGMTFNDVIPPLDSPLEPKYEQYEY